MSQSRIGIFSGTFDPIHAGHLNFALHALKLADLQSIYFLPERRPRYKKAPEHFGHRTAMITRAIRPHQQLGLLELPDIHFDVKRTFPKLQKEFQDTELVFLLGSDEALRLREWQDVKDFVSGSGLVIGLRTGHTAEQVRESLARLGCQPLSLHFVQTPMPHISSTAIRKALRANQAAAGLLASVRRYAKSQWLYASVARE